MCLGCDDPMSVTPQVTYPGVYIQEVPSGVRTITGVATSITAFIGRAKRGPVDDPVTINSYADFERIFGGLWIESPMSYAVRDFYLNGGGQAIIVRLFHEESSTKRKAGLKAGTLELEAAYPGAWGNKLRARVDHETKDPADTKLFNLAVRDGETGLIEEFRNVSVKDDHARRVDKVLLNESILVRVKEAMALPSDRPDAHDAGDGKDIWVDNTPATSSKVDQEASDGLALNQNDFIGTGKQAAKQGLYALEKADLFNILCIPPYAIGSDIVENTSEAQGIIGAAAKYCEDRRAMFLVDPKSAWTKNTAKSGVAGIGTKSKNAALFFPSLKQPNPLRENQKETFAPCGAIAGIFARTDAQRGVWKAPAGLDATLVGQPELSVPLTDAENGELNPLGINCLRVMPAVGPVVWGSRTLHGDDRLASEWKYIPVRRMALFIEESLYRGTKWVVFEPNDEPLWAQIRLNVGAFMHTLFRQGAFQGKTPQEAYFVKCDKETTTQDDINRGIVNILVGFAPLRPAEFVVIKISQIAGQIQT